MSVSSILFLFIFLISVASATDILNVPSPTYPTWEKCKVLPLLNETCIKIVAFPNNLTATLTISIRNHTVYTDTIDAGKICLDDESLLELLELIPEFKPFEPIIKELLRVEHFIPGEVFSICAQVTNTTWTKSDFSGCVDLSTVLMCWRGKCLFKGTHDFGCFKIPIHEADYSPKRGNKPFHRVIEN